MIEEIKQGFAEFGEGVLRIIFAIFMVLIIILMFLIICAFIKELVLFLI